MRNICQVELMLENHRPESLARLIEVYDKWKQHFMEGLSTLFEAREASSEKELKTYASTSRTEIVVPEES